MSGARGRRAGRAAGADAGTSWAVYAGFAVGVPVSALIAPERIAVASATAFLSSQLLDVWMFDKLRHEKPWWRAPLVSTTVSSGLDSGMFATLAWYGTDLPWITLGLGDWGAKVGLAVLSLGPFRVLTKGAVDKFGRTGRGGGQAEKR